MIRLILLSVFLAGLVVYAWRDWYTSLCGLVLLMAVIEHPDMPKSIMGIQGLNPWNIAMLFVLFAWLAARGKEGLSWDMPRGMSVLLLLYLLVIVVTLFRLVLGENGGLSKLYSPDGTGFTAAGVISEFGINCVKWVLPGLLMFDGCRTRRRFLMGLASLLAIYFLLAVQVIKWMPLSEAGSGSALSERSLKILVNEIGYHRVNMSMMLSGASWAVLAAAALAKNWVQRVLIVAMSFVIVLGQALTGGRTGYGTWAVVGLMLSVLRWRKMLLLAPLMAFLAVTLVPGTVERMMQGFTAQTRDYNPRIAQQASLYGDEGPDLYTVTSGRNIAWRHVLAKIEQAPLLGYGRMAMQTTGITAYLLEKYGESFPHPHNAYLEILLDSGVAGLVIVLAFYLSVLGKSLALFLSRTSPVCVAAGGAAFALVLALLAASVGSQSFYPREGSVGMWCAIGLMLRVHVERRRAARGDGAGGETPFDFPARSAQ